MHVEDLKQRLDAKDEILVLDVREPDEYKQGTSAGN
jgi:rhodanese-related sulfurtransferase